MNDDTLTQTTCPLEMLDADFEAKSECLDIAKAAVNGARARDYGTVYENFKRTGDLWAVILGHPVEPWQVALCMDAVKTARLINSPDHMDSWVDKAGYSACGHACTKGRP